jgi:hypothetical protein
MLSKAARPLLKLMEHLQQHLPKHKIVNAELRPNFQRGYALQLHGAISGCMIDHEIKEMYAFLQAFFLGNISIFCGHDLCMGDHK